MKAVLRYQYGGPEVLTVEDIPKPKIGAKEVLVQVIASSITRADAMMRQGEPRFARLFLGLTRPKYNKMGTGFAGKVVEVGQEVNRFKVGDAVFGESGLNLGANAEYLSVEEDGIILPMPEGMDYQEACLMCDGPLTSLNFLRNLGKVEPGNHVLINGAAGSLGTAAIPLAKAMGAHVTGVCSTKNVAFVYHLGADNVIDYKKDDFTRFPQTYDVIYDTVGTIPFTKAKKALKNRGLYLTPVLTARIFGHVLLNPFRSKKALFTATGLEKKTILVGMINDLADLYRQGKFKVIIEKSYPMEEIADAHYLIDSGHKRANLVLSIGG